jgi:peptide/nickel transport system permease protein
MAKRSILGAVRRFLLLAAMTLIAALIAGWLTGISPGSGIDVLTLDTRLSDESVASLQRGRDFGAWFGGLLGGDLGESTAYGRPVVELVRGRLPATVGLVGTGLLLGWGSALAALLLALAARSAALDSMLAGLSGATISQPAALLALICLQADLPGSFAIGVLLFPQIFAYLRNLTDRILDEPHVLAAQARGVPRAVIIVRHVLLRAAPTALSLFGVSISIALGAAVPVEVICDLPGIGQLLLEAALSRDLPLIVSLTAVVAFVTISANFAAEALGAAAGAQPE